MNIQQIEYALAVSQLNSFGKAAEQCNVTQSTLSTMVGRLEGEIGIELFDRRTKPVKLTEEGKLLLPQMLEMSNAMALLKERVNEIKGKEHGELRIGVIPTVAPYLLPSFLDGFAKENTTVSLFVFELTTDKIIQDLNERKLDVGILSTPINSPGIIETPLYNEPFVFYDAGWREKSSEVSLSDIDYSRLLLLEEGHCMRNQVFKICELNKQSKKKGSSSNLKYQTTSIDTLLRFAEKNGAVTLLPLLAAKAHFEDHQNKWKAFSGKTPSREISLVVHQHFVKKRMKDKLVATIQDKVKPMLKFEKKEEFLIPPF